MGSNSEDTSMDTDDRPVRKCKYRFNANACEILSELRENGQLCDAVLKVENRSFPVHRAILSTCSPYFRSLFTSSLADSTKREFVIPKVSADIMELAIKHAYGRRITITQQNVERLLPVADHFHMNTLMRACSDFLEEQICAENCLGIRTFAKAYFCRHLERSSWKFIMRHFDEISEVSQECLQMNVDDLCEILSSDDLNIRKEETAFEAIIRWIDFDAEHRRGYIARLMKNIRLGLLPTQFFVETVKTHPYVKDNDACKPIIIETLKFLYDLDMETEKEVDLNNPLSKPRVPHEILFVTGGWSGGSPTNVVETYDTRADRWIMADTVDNGPRAYHSTISVGHKIFVIGGFDGMDYFNNCRCFDASTKKWHEAAPMNNRRCYISAACLNGYVYAMGGYDGHFRQNSAEKYLPQKNQWSMIAPMNTQRSDASATSLEGRVYICGGFNGQEVLNSAESYNPETNQWTNIVPMRNRRSGIGVIAYRDCIYALGGFNGMSRMNSGERYNPKTNKWITIPEMYNPRSNFAIEVIDEMIFAIGGFNGVTTIFNVECYDAEADEWYDATDMNIYRSALSACVVRDLPNIQDYAFKQDETKPVKSKKTGEGTTKEA